MEQDMTKIAFRLGVAVGIDAAIRHPEWAMAKLRQLGDTLSLEDITDETVRENPVEAYHEIGGSR